MGNTSDPKVKNINNVTISDQELQTAIQREAMAMAQQYGLQPQQAFDLLRQNPQAAVALARDNHAVQREPRDARILLEAAIAAKDSASAEPARDWLRTSGFEDARLRRLGQASGASASTGGSR